jgi:hypothetical protein
MSTTTILDTGPILYTMEEAAARLHMSRKTLQRMIVLHRHYRIAGRRKVFSPGDLHKLADALPCPSSSFLPEAPGKTMRSGARSTGNGLSKLLERLG